MKTVRFDDSLPLLVDVIKSTLGESDLQAGTVLRDVAGRLAFFAATPLDEATIDQLSAKLRETLGGYARSDRVIAGSDDFASSAVLQDPSALAVNVGASRVRLVDRRLVGADWLRAPYGPAKPPARIVFASLKGGVGRSTALAIVASHLAMRGKRVLAIDLDMEAPGLGSLLLTSDTLPEFGVIDALVENGLSPLDEEFLADLIGPSDLASWGGKIDVVPAFGRRSLQHPADVLAKLARAYTEDIRADGTADTLLDQVRMLVGQLADPTRYDVALIDARAGLHESAASAILGLGAEILLFGVDEPQTFQGYNVLFSHLAQFVVPGGGLPEWLDRLTMVQGKAPADAEERAEFADRCRHLFATAGFGLRHNAAREVTLPAGSFSDVPWDDEIPDGEVFPSEWSFSDPLAVLYDAQFERFDPLRRRDLISESIYRATFGDILNFVDTALTNTEEISTEGES